MGYWKKRKKAFGYAWQGVRTLFRSEAHAKIHGLAAVIVIAAGFFFKISPAEWCAVIFCIGGVLMAEGFNTALERVCDKTSPEFHPLIKDAKDVAAGAVLLFVIASVIIGLIIFIPKILPLTFLNRN